MEVTNEFKILFVDLEAREFGNQNPGLSELVPG